MFCGIRIPRKPQIGSLLNCQCMEAVMDIEVFQFSTFIIYHTLCFWVFLVLKDAGIYSHPKALVETINYEEKIT